MAFELFERAAELGSSHAMVNLGDMYRDGVGTAMDLEMARTSYDRALAAGHKIAKARLKQLSFASSAAPVVREKVIVEREKVIVQRAADQGPSSEEIFRKLNKSVFMLVVGDIKKAKGVVLNLRLMGLGLQLPLRRNWLNQLPRRREIRFCIFCEG